jgi:hypothetical protein
MRTLLDRTPCNAKASYRRLSAFICGPMVFPECRQRRIVAPRKEFEQ